MCEVPDACLTPTTAPAGVTARARPINEQRLGALAFYLSGLADYLVLCFCPVFRFSLLQPYRVAAPDGATPEHRSIDTDISLVVLCRRAQDAWISG